MLSRVFLCLVLMLGAAARAPEDGYSREQLQPLTQFRHVLPRSSRHVVAKRRWVFCQAAAPQDHRPPLSIACALGSLLYSNSIASVCGGQRLWLRSEPAWALIELTCAMPCALSGGSTVASWQP